MLNKLKCSVLIALLAVMLISCTHEEYEPYTPPVKPPADPWTDVYLSYGLFGDGKSTGVYYYTATDYSEGKYLLECHPGRIGVNAGVPVSVFYWTPDSTNKYVADGEGHNCDYKITMKTEERPDSLTEIIEDNDTMTRYHYTVFKANKYKVSKNTSHKNDLNSMVYEYTELTDTEYRETNLDDLFDGYVVVRGNANNGTVEFGMSATDAFSLGELNQGLVGARTWTYFGKMRPDAMW